MYPHIKAQVLARLIIVTMVGMFIATSAHTNENQAYVPKETVLKNSRTALFEARAKISEAIDEMDFSRDSRLLITHLIERAEIDQQVGANIAALQDLQFAFRLAASTNQHDLVANIALEIAHIHQTRGEHIIAISYAEQAIAYYDKESIQHNLMEAVLLHTNSLLATEQGSQAQTQLKSIGLNISQTGNKEQQARYYTLVGQLALMNENIEASLAALNTSEKLTDADNNTALARLHLLASKANAMQQNIDAAIADLVIAFEFAEKGDVPFVLRQSLQLHRAELLSQLDEYQAAYAVTKNIIQNRNLVQPITDIKRMLDMHANFQLEIQQQENADLKQENKWQTAQIETKQTLSRLYLLIMALLFFVSCLLLLVFVRGKRHHKHLENLAHTDQLTSLHSRAKILELLNYHQALFKRSQQNYCVGIVDLDYFKRINDSYGHQVGDGVLRAFGKLCHDSFRKSDVIGRIGGEEFLFILPNTPHLKAIEVFTQFNKRLLTIGTSLTIEQATTASIGLVQPSEKETVPEIIKRADDALYQAKHEGRNRVIFSNT